MVRFTFTSNGIDDAGAGPSRPPLALSSVAIILVPLTVKQSVVKFILSLDCHRFLHMKPHGNKQLLANTEVHGSDGTALK